ncbi:MAG: branched-chain amino acid ABC transporter permease [Rhizobiaceae bacterium]
MTEIQALYLLQQVLNGAHAGALYAALAFGYALTNGVLKRTNLAYGAVFAFAGQVLILAAVFGWRVLWLDLPATILLGLIVSSAYAALVSAVISRQVFAPLARSSPNAIVTATLGISLVLMELGRIAAETRDYWLPPLLSKPVVFADGEGFAVTLTVLQVTNCAIVLGALLAGAAILARSSLGRAWRAVSDDPRAAALVGIDTARVFHGTILAGGLVAAVAGALAALHYGNISFGTGLVFGLKVLFIAAVGGYLSPGRAAVGGLAFGVAEAVWSGYFPIEWRDAAMFLGLVALLVMRPARDRGHERA